MFTTIIALAFFLFILFPGCGNAALSNLSSCFSVFRSLQVTINNWPCLPAILADIELFLSLRTDWSDQPVHKMQLTNSVVMRTSSGQTDPAPKG